jgi:fructuronate reductase
MTYLRLTPQSAQRLPASFGRPTYDRTAIKTGVVHLGIGNFHRAHQAAYFDRALSLGDNRWGIIGASLRSPDVRNRMAPQSCLYILTEVDGAGTATRLLAPIRDIIVASEDRARLILALAHPDVQLVTLTITEKGYGQENGTAADFITAALAERRARGIAPFTTISCDNLPENGRVMEKSVLGVAALRDPALHDWIAANGAFPNSMVDRIVPATTADDIAELAAKTGVEDRAMVKTEAYSQWVIEDRFCAARPDFAALGVDLVHDVAPWEATKLRLLNGAHSALAYLGALAGYEYVHQAIAAPSYRALIARLWDESGETLATPGGPDIAIYQTRLLNRFANPALQHRTAQIAMDGSQKLPQRLVAPLKDRLARGLDSPALTLAIAGWMRWQMGLAENGDPIIVDDPMAEHIAKHIVGLHMPEEIVRALLAVEPIFGADLQYNPDLQQTLAANLQSLLERGAAATVASLPS